MLLTLTGVYLDVTSAAVRFSRSLCPVTWGMSCHLAIVTAVKTYSLILYLMPYVWQGCMLHVVSKVHTPTGIHASICLSATLHCLKFESCRVQRVFGFYCTSATTGFQPASSIPITTAWSSCHCKHTPHVFLYLHCCLLTTVWVCA